MDVEHVGAQAEAGFVAGGLVVRVPVPEGGAGPGPQAGAGAQAEDVVDAEFTEVKDDNQK